MMATAIKTSPKRSEKRRPTYPQLHQMILDNHGNLAHVAAECGYSTRSVEMWIKEANEVTQLGLFEAIGKGKAEGKRQELLSDRSQRNRKSVPAFIVPSEIKALVWLHYHLNDDELNEIEIQYALETFNSSHCPKVILDFDSDKPKECSLPTIYKNLTWAELASVLASIEKMPVRVAGCTVNRWFLHVLLHWVNMGNQSPVFDEYEYLPDVCFTTAGGKQQVYLKYIEPIVRLLIKRLEPYL